VRALLVPVTNDRVQLAFAAAGWLAASAVAAVGPNGPAMRQVAAKTAMATPLE